MLRLERRGNRNRLTLVSLLFLMCAVMLTGATERIPETITAQNFVVVGQDGEELIRLGGKRREGLIEVFGNGKKRLKLTGDADVILYGTTEKPLVILTTALGTGLVLLRTSEGTDLVYLGAESDRGMGPISFENPVRNADFRRRASGILVLGNSQTGETAYLGDDVEGNGLLRLNSSTAGMRLILSPQQ